LELKFEMSSNNSTNNQQQEVKNKKSRRNAATLYTVEVNDRTDEKDARQSAMHAAALSILNSITMAT